MSYNLRSVKAPRLVGAGLAAFTLAIETWFSRKLLLPKLFADAGIARFRRERTEKERSPVMSPLQFPLPAAPELKIQKKTAGKTGSKSRKKTSFTFVSISDLHTAYLKRLVSPVEIADRFIDAVNNMQNQESLQAVIAMHEAEIMSAARISEARYKKKKPVSVLDGIPITIKDEVNVEGYPTKVGTTFLGVANERQDATVVARLRRAGAIIAGKNNMHEIGLGVTGGNVHYGFPKNPYAPNCYSGGSSSGSAVAVAAGLGPVSIGADGGGSIRIPASFNGVYGLKATHGRISEHGAFPLCPTVAHIGPIGTCTDDLYQTYRIIAGEDRADRASQRQPVPGTISLNLANIKNIRVGIYEPWFNHANTEIVAKCEEAMKFFQKNGAKIIPVEIKNLEEIRVAHLITIASEMRSAMEDYLKVHKGSLGYDTRINLALASEFKTRDYLQAQQIRSAAIEDLVSVFQKCDVVITPSTAVTAPEIKSDALKSGESNLSVLTEIMRFAPLGNLSGVPAISFPVGYDNQEKPIGMQAMAAWWNESQLFNISKVSEDFFTPQRPKLYSSLLS
ncbi:MAG: amidase [Leptospiraceae bacterium]|nr:amidase [Leptospiraceae bacterium]